MVEVERPTVALPRPSGATQGPQAQGCQVLPPEVPWEPGSGQLGQLPGVKPGASWGLTCRGVQRGQHCAGTRPGEVLQVGPPWHTGHLSPRALPGLHTCPSRPWSSVPPKSRQLQAVLVAECRAAACGLVSSLPHIFLHQTLAPLFLHLLEPWASSEQVGQIGTPGWPPAGGRRGH